MKPVEDGVVSISGFFWKLNNAVKSYVSSSVIFFKNKQKLVAEKEEFQNALRIAQVKTLLYDEVKQENEALKKILGRNDTPEGVFSRVLSHPNSSPYDVLIVDIGKDHELLVGSLVVWESVLLGVVDTVYARNAKIRLFSSQGTELPVELGKKKIPAIARGLGGGMFEIKIPRDIEVVEGEVIFYPSIHNYIVGTVSRKELKQTSSFQTILFRAPINIFTVQNVIVTDDLILKIEEQ